MIAPAGWTLADPTDVEPERPCSGSGQIAAPWAPARTPCPECRRIVARDPYTFTLPDHYPDPDGAAPLPLGL